MKRHRAICSDLDSKLGEELAMKKNIEKAYYDPPALAELGDFAELTRGFGTGGLDAVDFFSGSWFFCLWVDQYGAP
jgi:hypothetical protein